MKSTNTNTNTNVTIDIFGDIKVETNSGIIESTGKFDTYVPKWDTGVGFIRETVNKEVHPTHYRVHFWYIDEERGVSFLSLKEAMRYAQDTTKPWWCITAENGDKEVGWTLVWHTNWEKWHARHDD